MIKVVDLTQHYGVRPVLKDVNLEVADGELAAVMGPNGMGKTTLLAAIAGVLSPQKGRIEIDGLVRRRTEEEELEIRRRMVYLPADAWLPLHQTGRQFLLAVGRLYEVEEERLLDHVERLLDLFNLERQGDSPMGSYSAGQKKKIALASALATERRILILDEPFSGGLDPSGIMAMKHVLKQLATRDDVTIVMATPVPELVEELADRIVVLHEGRILAAETAGGLRRLSGCDGPLEEVLERLINPRTESHIQRYLERETR